MAIRRGLLLGFLASLSWGTAFTMGEVGERLGADPIFLAFGRYLVAALVLAPFAVVRQRAQLREAVRKRPFGLAFLGLTGIFGMGAMGFAALRFTTSINASILMNANPIFTVVLAALVGERLSSDKLLGVSVGLLGCVLVVSGGTMEPFKIGPTDVPGCLLALGSGVCWSIYTVYGKGVVRECGGIVATTAAMVVGVVLFVLYTWIVGTPVTLAPKVVLTILYLGVVPTAIGFLMWYVALATEDASHLAPLQFTAPLCTAVLGWLFLNERMTWVSMGGVGFIFAGIYVACIRANAKT